jgi:hypothetical protein
MCCCEAVAAKTRNCDSLIAKMLAILHVGDLRASGRRQVHLLYICLQADTSWSRPHLAACASTSVCLQGGVSSRALTLQLAVLASLFGLVAFDVFGARSPHLLQGADQYVHSVVHATVPAGVTRFSDKALSNTPIVLGALGCFAGLCSLAALRPREGATAAAVLAVMNVMGAKAACTLRTCRR